MSFLTKSSSLVTTTSSLSSSRSSSFLFQNVVLRKSRSTTSSTIRCPTTSRFKSTTTTTSNSTASNNSVTATSTTSTATTSTTTSIESTSTNHTPPLLHTTIAAILGITTVSIAATIIEKSTSTSIPPFDPIHNNERFDQSTFYGRFCKMILACDPKLLLYTQEETKRAKDMVLQYQQLLADTIAANNNTTNNNSNTNNTNNNNHMTVQQMHHALWEAQRISSASLHPDTNDTIPQPFRMSGYVPYNGPVCVAMVASTSTPSLLFWSWVNQSQNALVNYFNRNASSEMDNQTLFKSYSAAVTSALLVAFGLATFIQKRYDATRAKQLMRYVAFPSAVVASSLNCYIVRSPEIDTGIPLLNSNYDNVSTTGQTSKIAAKEGVHSTTASRALLQAPVYFLPPLLMNTIPFLKNFVLRHPSMSVPLTTYLVLVSFGLGLPATVAIFPQMAEIDVKDVEEEFQGLRGNDGLPYQKFYYNKGL